MADTNKVKTAPALHPRPEGARKLGVSVRTIDYLISQKELRAVRIGRRVLVSENALADYIQRQEK